MKKITVLASAFLLLTFGVYAQNGREKIKVTDLLNVKTVGNVVVNSDGSKIAYTVMSIEPDTENKWEYKYVTQIWMAWADDSQKPRQLTFAKEGASQPAFSPDGKQIAFVRAAEGKSQIFLLNLDGGEPAQLTRLKYGASSPKWFPDGKKIIFSSSVSLKDLLTDSVLNPKKELPRWNSEKPGFVANNNLKANTAKPNPDGSMDEIRAYLEQNEKDKKAKALTKLQFQEEATTSNEYSFSHLFITEVQAGATAKAITSGFASFFNPQIDLKNNRLIVDARVDDEVMPDRVLESEVYSINLNNYSATVLLGKKEVAYGSASLSPSGKWLAYTYGNTGFVSVPTLAIMPLNGSEKDKVEIVLDRNKGGFTWSEDERYLYFTAQSNGGTVLYKADVATRKTEQLTDYNSGINSFALKNNKIYFAKNDVNNPSELYVSDVAGKNLSAITSLNSWVQQKNIIQPEKHIFINDKGMTVEYWVMKPANYEAGKKYPLLLEIHGGPSAMWGPGEASMWHEFQYFCSQGYGVVYSNPRGSGGYGVDFLKGNVKDWGDGPTSDVLTALNKTVAEGWADTSKLLITGGSYAGYLVSWIISHDHRFKAACSQRGVYDLSTFFGEGNAWRLVPNYFGGYPWQPEVKKLLDYESPITYVENITTPYIIFHGENDLRTGVIQGEMLYKSLKVLGRPVEYVRHPGATHEITRSGNNRQRIDQMLRTYEFFERWIH
ncbi:MAG: S9 family peptidase [Sphingobacteriia bacterium]|nr:S9 family peptidase [Sphingobacteriia bacterium]